MFIERLGRTSFIARRSFSIFSVARARSSYEGEGKTTVKVLNQDYELGLMIDAFANYGFRLNNGVTVLGPMAIFPKTVLSWQVRDSTEVTPGSLRLFKLIAPQIDLLIIGLETNSREATDRVFLAARQSGLNVEILPTEHACSTFNFLNAEGRCIAAALVPPVVVTMDENDQLATSMHYRNVYNNFKI